MLHSHVHGEIGLIELFIGFDDGFLRIKKGGSEIGNAISLIA